MLIGTHASGQSLSVTGEEQVLKGVFSGLKSDAIVGLEVNQRARPGKATSA